jgi:hypothetical protein
VQQPRLDGVTLAKGGDVEVVLPWSTIWTNDLTQTVTQHSAEVTMRGEGHVGVC